MNITYWVVGQSPKRTSSKISISVFTRDIPSSIIVFETFCDRYFLKRCMVRFISDPPVIYTQQIYGMHFSFFLIDVLSYLFISKHFVTVSPVLEVSFSIFSSSAFFDYVESEIYKLSHISRKVTHFLK
jgi:hypothetical protein